MFNGIIFNTGKINSIKKDYKSILISIKSNLNLKEKEIGSSVCCNGVCLTVTKVKKDLIYFYISRETINRSNFISIKKNQIINLEKSLLYGQKISGHFIQGHVDTVAKIKKIIILGKTWIIRFKLKDNKYKKLIVEKGSVSINGVSLTISKVLNDYFEINVIPHSLKLTNLKNLKKNDLVNVELDIFSKYIYKYSN
jgi:riboflavin synthase